MQNIILNAVSGWISSIFMHIPKKLRPSSLELLLGHFAASNGHISDALLSIYAKRWFVEPAFNEIKNTFGLSQAWQQTKNAFARWRCFLWHME